jgi:hypothetical protein
MQPTPGAQEQERAAYAFAKRIDLRRRVIKESFIRINRVRKTVGRARLPDEILPSYAQSALTHGFYRALIEKFSEAKGFGHEWWVEKRRLNGRHGKDRTADLEIILDCCPDFRDFYAPLTDGEVVAAAKQEFFDSVAASGTDYHQIESQRRHRGVNSGVVMLTKNAGRFEAQPVPDAKIVVLDTDEGRIDFVDPTAHEDVENVVSLRMLQDDADPLGPVITRVAERALREYGQNGLFWLVERLFLPTRFTEVLRALGGDEEELGAVEFERIKRDMVRKLPEVHERMMELLKDDPDIAVLHEMITNGTQTGRLQPVPSHRANPPKENPVVAGEKARYVERHIEKLFDRLLADDEEDLALYLLDATIDKTVPIIHEFLRIGDDAKLWKQFKCRLVKVQRRAA